MSRLDEIDDWLNHEPCCDHAGADEHGCWECLNTGHAHAQHISPEDARALVKFAKAVKAFTYRSPNGYDPAYDEIRDLLTDLEHPA
jgi:hypothetical protein